MVFGMLSRFLSEDECRMFCIREAGGFKRLTTGIYTLRGTLGPSGSSLPHSAGTESFNMATDHLFFTTTANFAGKDGIVWSLHILDHYSHGQNFKFHITGLLFENRLNSTYWFILQLKSKCESLMADVYNRITAHLKRWNRATAYEYTRV